MTDKLDELESSSWLRTAPAVLDLIKVFLIGLSLFQSRVMILWSPTPTTSPAHQTFFERESSRIQKTPAEVADWRPRAVLFWMFNTVEAAK
ncbi:hypothetical protein GLAREA_07583 [Glarea lozoyensis ATCC 20868]|uniref:Uncharacterized protein n=1 Tax=Glarea lozoyensis (strain ATCC 20868 / MF5171) TaxID=1116229 RepID=S3D3S9_GLAL2|nr:uncharacterized protein GLAREA_07583 [Glarea lozoyensis ATCC 20868]EPE32450.1 hypothetical protein GLAREA_07583 [Glarea lozoyensis ATCC 20868]